LKIEFSNKELLKLYTTGKSKKYQLNQNVIRKFFMRIQQLEAAKDIYDLWTTPSVKFEKIKSSKKMYSLRIDRVYRLEVQIEFENKEKTEGKVFIKMISKHYGE